MNRVRAVVLGAVLAVVTVLGVMPAASAADPFGLAWQNWSSTVTPGSPGQLCATGQPFQVGQTVQMQVLTNNVWVTRRTYTVASGMEWSCIQVSPSHVVARPGRYAWRAITQVSPSAPVVAARTTVNANADSNYVSTETATYTMTVQAKRVTATIATARGQVVDLQRRDGTVWRTVARLRTPTSGSNVTLRFAVPARAGNAAYRVVSHATGWVQQGVSPSFGIHQTDYVRYAGYISTIKRYVAQFCPQTPIYVDSALVLPGNASNPQNAIGRAVYSWSWGGGPNTLTTTIHFRSGMTGTQLRHVALHECAHVVQARALVVGQHGAEENRAWQVWPYNGFEGQADCMAYHFVRDPWSLYYVPGCTAGQLAEAVRMWDSYGYRFQSSPYVWSGTTPAGTAGTTGEVVMDTRR